MKIRNEAGRPVTQGDVDAAHARRRIGAAWSQLEAGWGLQAIAGSMESKLTPLFIMADLVMDRGEGWPAAPFDLETALWIAELRDEYGSFCEVLEAIYQDPTRATGDAR